jgi:predicted DNA binding CopG/RHH family protein
MSEKSPFEERIWLRISSEVGKALRREARQKGILISELIRIVLDEHITENNKLKNLTLGG